MIKANEVRVGNRFIRDLHGTRGMDFDPDFILDEDNMGMLFVDIRLCLQDLYPIPLTPEILEKCGFKHWDNDWWFIKLFWLELSVNINDGEVCIQPDNKRGSQLFSHGHLKCKYLHQLQNLYFALTGEELTIPLT